MSEGSDECRCEGGEGRSYKERPSLEYSAFAFLNSLKPCKSSSLDLITP